MTAVKDSMAQPAVACPQVMPDIERHRVAVMSSV
jgi:hypothetical protein